MSDADAIARKLDFMRADIEEPGSSPAARLIAGHASLLLGAVEAVLKLGDRSGEAKDPTLPGHVDVYMIREAITAELTGKEAGDEPGTRPSSSMQNPAGVVRVIAEEADDGG